MTERLQFSGPAAFWSLLPLAFNVMLQPSGRCCGFHLCCRTYLRAMPLICAADTLSIIVRLATNWIAGLPIRRAAAAALESRYQCCSYCNAASPSESLYDLENNPSLRWIAFFYATSPIAVKLFFIRGIPWTKAWAYMYLAEFVAVEFVLLISDSQPNTARPNFRTVERLSLQLQQRWDQKLKPIHDILGKAVLIAQWTLPICMGLDSLLNGFVSTLPFGWLIPISSITAIFIYISNFGEKFVRIFKPNLSSWIYLLVPAFQLINGLYHTGTLIIAVQKSEIGSYGRRHLLYGVSFLFSLCTPLVLRLFLKWRFWRSNVYFLRIRREGARTDENIELEATAIFHVVLFTSLNALMWYGLIYNAESTEKPAWLEWLG